MVKLIKKIECGQRQTGANQNKLYGVKHHGASKNGLNAVHYSIDGMSLIPGFHWIAPRWRGGFVLATIANQGT